MNISQGLCRWTIATIIIVGSLLLGACTPEKSNSGARANVFSLDIPRSLTGTRGTPTVASLARAVGTGQPCSFQGSEIEDPFKNGYQMTKFLISAIAAWTCVADSVIEIVDYIPHNGTIIESDNIKGEPGYDDDEATHYSVTDESATHVTVRLYYGYYRATPPTDESVPDFFISWDDDDAGNLQGRLIIDATTINAADRNPEDPSRMRMDFNYGPTEKLVNMYLQFDQSPWANGFRIELSKDLTASPSPLVFTASGIMDMNRQFLPNVTSTELPKFAMLTVSDKWGNGAASAEFLNVAIPLELNVDSHLGEYIVDINDLYYFQDDQDWDWINKNVVRSEFRGQRTTPPTGGSWDPFNPSLDLIILAFGLDSDYFTGIKCATYGNDCNAFMNAIYQDKDGFAGEDPNQGEDPQDWRNDALADLSYLTSVYPEGFSSWTGVFETVFTP